MSPGIELVNPRPQPWPRAQEDLMADRDGGIQQHPSRASASRLTTNFRSPDRLGRASAFSSPRLTVARAAESSVTVTSRRNNCRAMSRSSRLSLPFAPSAVVASDPAIPGPFVVGKGRDSRRNGHARSGPARRTVAAARSGRGAWDRRSAPVRATATRPGPPQPRLRLFSGSVIASRSCRSVMGRTR